MAESGTCREHTSIVCKLDAISETLRRMEDMQTKTVQALYGCAGELNGSGIGLVARMQNMSVRVDDLEKTNEEVKRTAKDVIIAILPYVLGGGGLAAAIAALLGAR